MNSITGKRLAVALVAVATLSVVAQAAMMVVEQSESTTFIRGERFDLDSSFTVPSSQIDVAPDDQDAIGSSAFPVEISPEKPKARTGVQENDWLYTAVIEEKSAASLASGTFQVDLYLSGGGYTNKLVGTLYVAQNDASSNQVEGARLTWDLGPDLPANPLFVLKAHPYTPTGKTASFTLESAYSAVDGYVWKGVGGEIDGQTNPDLEVEQGTAVTFTVRHGCGAADSAPHNLFIQDAGGDQVAKSETVSSCGDETTLTWTPSGTGEYAYVCQYHASSQKGTLTVEASSGGSSGEAESFTLESAYDPVEGYVWKGVGGEIDGQTNPTLSLEPGMEVTFTIRHGCGGQDTAPHNLVIKDGSGTQQAKSDDVTACDDETTLTWTSPNATVEYAYECLYHASSQKGGISVQGSGG